MKPKGMEVLSHEDGLILFVPVRERWWQFWVPRQAVTVLARHEVIWLRQVIFKVMTEQVSEGNWTGVNELERDIGRGLMAVSELDMEVAKLLAHSLWEKGYRK